MLEGRIFDLSRFHAEKAVKARGYRARRLATKTQKPRHQQGYSRGSRTFRLRRRPTFPRKKAQEVTASCFTSSSLHTQETSHARKDSLHHGVEYQKLRRSQTVYRTWLVVAGWTLRSTSTATNRDREPPGKTRVVDQY